MQKPGVDTGIWVEQMISTPTLGSAGPVVGVQMPGMSPEMPGRNPALQAYGEAGAPTAPVPPAGDAAAAVGQAANTNIITLVCRAISLTSVDPSANRDIAYAVENEIKASPLVDPKSTSLDGNIVPDDANGTFTFTLKVAPLNPLNF